MTQLGERFQEAFLYACALHGHQSRKGTPVPYISHLMAVAALVLEHGGGEQEAIAALLHDAVEDQGGLATLEEIRRRFGEKVAQLVQTCSDSLGSPKPPWEERKKGHLKKLQEADASALLVCAADKLHNARCLLQDYRLLGDRLWQRFRADGPQTLWYYQSLAELLEEKLPGPLTQELRRTVDTLHQLMQGR